MIEKRQGCDRRGDYRHPAAGQCMWRKSGSRATFQGWLSDRSRTSVSFITASAAPSASGDEIELIGPGRSHRQYRITRIAPYDGHLSLIACRGARSRGEEQTVLPPLEVWS